LAIPKGYPEETFDNMENYTKYTKDECSERVHKCENGQCVT